MLVTPTSIWTPSQSRFGAWWRKPWRNPLAALMAHIAWRNASGNHIVWKDSHISWGCPVPVCSFCQAGTTPSSVDVIITGSDYTDPVGACFDCPVPSDPLVSYTSSGNLDGSWNLTPVSACVYEAAISKTVTYHRVCTDNTYSYSAVQTFGTVRLVISSTISALKVHMIGSETDTFDSDGHTQTAALDFIWSGPHTSGTTCLTLSACTGPSCVIRASTATLSANA